MTCFLELNSARSPISLPILPGFQLVTTSIGSDGEAIRFWTPENSIEDVFARTEHPNFASFPKTHTKRGYLATLCITTEFATTMRELTGVTAAYPHIQMLLGGRVLVAAARCQRLPDGSVEKNAKVFGSDGSVESEFCLGDGIQHLQSDAEDRLWVGYFDEGVFGNFGWGFRNDNSGPLGAAGLVCFDSSGQKLWEYEAPEGFDSIHDCYALNVDEDAVWTCYYSDFPIARVNSIRDVTGWYTDLSGPNQLAVSKGLVLAYGGYKGQQTDCSLLRLGSENAEKIAEVKLVLPENIDLEKSTVIGRGALLHVFAENQWWAFRVPEFPPNL